MTSAEYINKKIKRLKLSASAGLDKRVHNDISKALVELKKIKSTHVEPNLWRIIMKNRITKLAAVVTIVIGAGALATTVGLKVRKLYFKGREPDSTYIFQTKPETIETEDGRKITNMRTITSHRVDDVEQKIKDLEEVELLRQQDTSRELLSVVETEVNGKLQPRSLKFKYILSDGREIKLMEGDPDTQDLERSLTDAQRDEVTSLLRADKYEELDIKEKQVRGRMFVFQRQRYVLSDGTEVIKSVGRPK
jgi:hypothetical protein